MSRQLFKNLPSKRKKLFLGFALLVVLYLGFCADFYARQEWYLLEPNVVPPGHKPMEFAFDPYVLTVKSGASGEATIHYRRYPTSTTPRNEAIFFLHGNKGNMDLCEFQIEFMLNLGYDVWTMDYRSYGDSSGPISEAALKEDAAQVFNEIVNENPTKTIVIWGRSFGSGIAAATAASATQKPKMLVLETPYWSLSDAARQKFPFIPPVVFRYDLPINQFLIPASYPVHLIHGTQDEKIPANSSDRLHQLCLDHNISVTGYSIMCGKHDLRDPKTVAEFQQIAERILK